MNVFDSIDTVKSLIKDRILSNQELLKLVSVLTEDPLVAKDITDLSKIVNKSIFFSPKTLDTNKDQKVFVTMETSLLSNMDGNRLIDVYFTFNIYCHIDLLELCDSRTRPWMICSCLSNMFTNSWGSWMGKMELEDGYEIIEIPNSYYGIKIRFSLSDFI